MLDDVKDSRIAWHPAFNGAIELELNENKDDLLFDDNHYLSKEPLQMDMLIIKKINNVVIKNQIGAIFRRYNIWEFKSPDDNLTIDNYIKTAGYAYIFKGLGKSVDEIPLRELTVSMLRDVYPERLFYTIETMGGQIERKYPGIYYVYGIVNLPTQIIVSSQLDSANHAALKVLSKNAKEEDVRLFLSDSQKYENQGDLANVNAVLQVSTMANQKLYSRIRRDERMCQALMELMKDEIDEKVEQEVEKAKEKTEERITTVNLKNLMTSLNLTKEQAMDALMIPSEKRQVFMVNLSEQ